MGIETIFPCVLAGIWLISARGRATIGVPELDVADSCQSNQVQPAKRLPSKLEELSDELWLLIASSLDSSDQASLALTCRHTSRLFGSALVVLKQSSRRKDRLKLMFRLHHRYPRHYLCEFCIKYHLKATPFMDYRPHTTSLYLFPGMAPLQLKTAVDAMTGFLARPSKAVSCLGYPGESGVTVHQGTPWRSRLDAVVHAKHLLLRLTHNMVLSTSFQQNPRFEHIPCCVHFQNPASLLSKWRKAVRAVPKPWEAELPNTYVYISSVYRCPLCPSEFVLYASNYDASVANREGATWCVTVKHYMDLGVCRSGHGVEWDSLTRPRRKGVLPNAPFDLEEKADVVERWRVARNSTSPPVIRGDVLALED